MAALKRNHLFVIKVGLIAIKLVADKYDSSPGSAELSTSSVIDENKGITGAVVLR